MAASIATPYVLKSLAQQAKQSLVDTSQPTVTRNLIHQFENLALEKITKYRDITVKSTTLTSLRNGKNRTLAATKLDMRHLGSSRIMDRREMLRQQNKLKEREEKTRLKELRRLEREKAKEAKERAKQAPPKRVRIILHVRPRPDSTSPP